MRFFCQLFAQIITLISATPQHFTVSEDISQTLLSSCLYTFHHFHLRGKFLSTVKIKAPMREEHTGKESEKSMHGLHCWDLWWKQSTLSNLSLSDGEKSVKRDEKRSGMVRIWKTVFYQIYTENFPEPVINHRLLQLEQQQGTCGFPEE